MATLTLFICILILWLAFLLSSRALNRREKGILAGVRFPEQAISDMEVTELSDDIASWRSRFGVVSLLTSLAVLIPTIYFSLTFSIFFLWMIGVGVELFRVQVKFEKRAKMLKNVRGWNGTENSDEKYWRYGVFYYNPNSPKLFVNKRYGIGSTVNLGTKAGKAIMTVIVVLVIGMIGPIWVGMVYEDVVPHKIVFSESEVTFKSLMYSETVPYADIENIYQIESLPNGVKTNGSATQLYLRGYFHYNGIGACVVFVQAPIKPYTVIERISGETVIFSAPTSEENQADYERLKDALNALN